jgi:DNA-binding transcriptional LysR family regulator
MNVIMDINALIIFYKVAETNSFSKTSKVLDIPISTISRKINKLEEDLKQKLFIRNTRKINLTIEGQNLYETSKPLFEQLHNLPNIFENNANLSGDIRITSTIEHQNYLAPKISAFKNLYPNINLHIHFSNDIKDLIEDSYDFAFRAGKLKDSSLYSYPLYSDCFSAYIHKNYYEQLNINDLSLYEHCLLENNSILYLEDDSYIKPKHKLVSNSIDFIQEYAALHKSIIFVPHYHIKSDFIKISFYKEKISFFNIVYLNKNLNKPCRLFLEFFKQYKQEKG